ncbi:hypothetical protein [Singulisphaera sp. PoT]|uniref:hypothetical protein n=1 Tax=Singulisphaera sp. PoT TaxID=3411797 RepID=UPI003BF5A806
MLKFTSLASHCAALVLALSSFVLAFFLLIDLCFMVVYFGSGGGTSQWWGAAWQKSLREIVQPGMMAIFIGWGALTVGTGLLGSTMARPGRETKAGTVLASLASLLSKCGMTGAALAATVLVALVGCRLFWSP